MTSRRVKSLLDVGGRGAGFESESLTREQRQCLRDDVERIERYFADDFDRSGARAFALYASSRDNLWLTLPLPAAVDDEVRLGLDLYLAPLLPLIGQGEGALVAVVSRERGEVYRLRGARLEQLVNEFEEAPSPHDQGGWSQARYHCHIEEIVVRHLRSVCEQIDRHVRREPSTQLVVVAVDELRSEVEALLAHRVAQRDRRLDERRGARGRPATPRRGAAGARSRASRRGAPRARPLARGRGA